MGKSGSGYKFDILMDREAMLLAILAGLSYLGLLTFGIPFGFDF